ncbi:MAG TPA: hypothetical protein PLP13_03850 [bacterium]|nr:hypothetical protein [bacterium]HXK45092.1 hypothetical protein [bacterium]
MSKETLTILIHPGRLVFVIEKIAEKNNNSGTSGGYHGCKGAYG